VVAKRFTRFNGASATAGLKCQRYHTPEYRKRKLNALTRKPDDIQKEQQIRINKIKHMKVAWENTAQKDMI